MIYVTLLIFLENNAETLKTSYLTQNEIQGYFSKGLFLFSNTFSILLVQN